MADLVVLTLSDGTTIRCANLNDAKEKAINHQSNNGKMIVEITPEAGGLMTTLEFDKTTQDWVAYN